MLESGGAVGDGTCLWQDRPMTPIEEKVKQLFDDNMLSEEALAAALERLIREHGQKPVRDAVRYWAKTKAAWAQSIAAALNGDGDGPAKQ
jgi:hypothetical protein